MLRFRPGNNNNNGCQHCYVTALLLVGSAVLGTTPGKLDPELCLPRLYSQGNHDGRVPQPPAKGGAQRSGGI